MLGTLLNYRKSISRKPNRFRFLGLLRDYTLKTTTLSYCTKNTMNSTKKIAQGKNVTEPEAGLSFTNFSSYITGHASRLKEMVRL